MVKGMKRRDVPAMDRGLLPARAAVLRIQVELRPVLAAGPEGREQHERDRETRWKRHEAHSLRISDSEAEAGRLREETFS